AGALINARVRRVYYGAKDSKAGSVESVTKLFELPYNHRPVARGGVREADCAALLQTFFEELREQRSK
ncbi:MAG: nucleoside deaminase, partial [Clostridia bacterium]|nr:nucleoside deaminase [Clostridia bacterium]